MPRTSTDTLRLAPEVAHVRPWWSWLGGGAGATIGYIVANVPGAVAGGASRASTQPLMHRNTSTTSIHPALAQHHAFFGTSQTDDHQVLQETDSVQSEMPRARA